MELCRLHKIDAEFHFMLECTYFEDARKVYLPRGLTYVHLDPMLMFFMIL